jgi:hypothetical protein
MKRLSVFMFAMLLAASLSFAQGTTGSGKTTPPAETKTTSGKKATKTTKAHKGAKKGGKKSSVGTTTPSPK